MVITIRSFLHSWHITRFVSKNNTTGASNGAETGYPSGSPELIPAFCFFPLVLSIRFRFTASDYPFSIFKFFVQQPTVDNKDCIPTSVRPYSLKQTPDRQLPAPVRTLLSSGWTMFGSEYENCPEFVLKAAEVKQQIPNHDLQHSRQAR